MSHTTDRFIFDPKSKQDKVRVTNSKNLPKLQIFKNPLHVTHFLKLLDKIVKWNGSSEYCRRYRVDTILSTDGQSDRQTDRQMDGQTGIYAQFYPVPEASCNAVFTQDGQTDKVKPVYPLQLCWAGDILTTSHLSSNDMSCHMGG